MENKPKPRPLRPKSPVGGEAPFPSAANILELGGGVTSSFLGSTMNESLYTDISIHPPFPLELTYNDGHRHGYCQGIYNDMDAFTELHTSIDAQEPQEPQEPIAVIPRKRQPKWRKIPDKEWDIVKPLLEHHYVAHNLPLKDVMLLLGVEGFIASFVAIESIRNNKLTGVQRGAV